MPSPRSSSPYQRCQSEKRITIASLIQQCYRVRDITRLLRCSASIMCREIWRKEHGDDGYSNAHVQGRLRRRSARLAPKLHSDCIRWHLVLYFLRRHWSPERVVLILARLHPKSRELRVLQDTIYDCIYALPMVELRKVLATTVRHAHNKRVPRGKGQDRRRQIPGMFSIHMLPLKIEDGQFLGHWEGIKEADDVSAVGTFVDRTSWQVMLVKLPGFRPASVDNVLQGFADKLLSSVQPIRQSMTYDQGRGMAMHK